MMVDILNYGIYCEGKHIADFEELDHAKYIAENMAINMESDTIIINNFTGEICGKFEVKFKMEVVEVEP